MGFLNSTFTEEEKKYIQHFRVAIFGSARIGKEDRIYHQVTELAKEIAENNIDIVTGGGPGLMEAANLGERLSNNTKSRSIGLTIQLPNEAKGNRHLDIKQHFQRFSNRLDHFMMLSNVVVVMPGGIGTCLELFYTWQLTQVHHIEPIPIILYGEMWQELFAWVQKYPLQKKLLSPEDLQNIHCVDSNEEVLEIILKEREKTEGTNHSPKG
ncbi:LOG family protein [Candidatus Gracilibacteria bacterium]|nr:LOG family protein [Candidatus Gracilibacteria bacterium]